MSNYAGRSLASMLFLVALIVGSCGEEAREGERIPPGDLANCLREQELQVISEGSAGPADEDAPSNEIVVRTGDANVLIGVYETETDARRAVTAVREHSTAAGAEAEQNLNLVIVWTQGVSVEMRARVRGCLL